MQDEFSFAAVLFCCILSADHLENNVLLQRQVHGRLQEYIIKRGSQMDKNIIIMNFSGVYEKQGLKAVLEEKCEAVNVTELDFRDISGTNCYCDGPAEEEIKKRICSYGPEGMHFLDSGNYHYLTKIWLELVKEPFELLVFDHHTDMQRPAFGGILSCGGWIREALETNPNLKHVVLVGPPEAAMEETKKELSEDGEELLKKITWISEEKFLENEENSDQILQICGTLKNSGEAEDLPLYLSIDKDVLMESEGKTNWDQGKVSLNQVLEFVKYYTERKRLIGVDVCGEDPEEENEEEQLVCRTTSEKISFLLN